MFGAYLAFGITAMFGLQALVNIGVVLGSLPTKGLPLPFISYGGTSLVMSLFIGGRAREHLGAQPRAGRVAARRACAGARSRGRTGASDAGPRIVVEVGPPRGASAPAASR